MGDYPISTALNVPTVAPQPSINCLQWSTDGQIVMTTKAAIYLLTPDLGIYFDIASVLKAPAEKHNSRDKSAGLTLGWFRTLIEFEKVVQHQWPVDTQEWGAVSLGSLDVTWRAATISPSNLTADAGCLLVAMSSNMELSLWWATKNYLKGAWVKIQDITTTLKELPLPSHDANNSHEHQNYLRTLHAQVNCIAWSPQAGFSLSPHPLLDGSLLALGNRAGSVILMRYDGKESVKHVQTVRVADAWVTHTAWGRWTSSRSGHCQAYLACGISDGSIVLVKIGQSLEQQECSTPFNHNFQITIDIEASHWKPAEADGKGITALTWVEGLRRGPLVVHAKPGILRFWRLPSSDSDPEISSQILRLRTQHVSVGSSSLTPVSGISYIQRHDALVVMLFDGSSHVVRNLSSEPTLNEDLVDVEGAEEPTFTSTNITRNTRAAFVKAEGTLPQRTDVNSTSGGISFDRSSTVAWLHEACRPTDFSYKHDAKHHSMLVVAQLWDSETNNQIVNELNETLAHTETATGTAPIHVLRHTFLALRHPKTFEAVRSDVLQILIRPFPDDVSGIVISAWTGDLDLAACQEFGRSLLKHLYGWNSLRSLRLRLAVADFCWKMSQSDEVREEFGQVAQLLLSSISHRLLRTFVRHITAITDMLTANDIPFVLRVIVQALLPGSPPDLLAEANDLSARIRTVVPASPDAFNLLSEHCPACNAEVPLENIIDAVCPNGHIWTRCSITSFLLSTPMVRTCIGCTRKALLPPSQRPPDSGTSLLWIPEAGRSWVVEQLLEAARCCLYCGNRFVRVL